MSDNPFFISKDSSAVNDSLPKNLSVCTFYHYHPIPVSQLNTIKAHLLECPQAQLVRGLILLSHEGINATLTGKLEDLRSYVDVIQEQTDISIQARWQLSDVWGFKKLRLKIKEEIVQTGKDDLKPPSSKTHLTPAEWKEAIEKEDVLLLDIRNDYEVAIGQFTGARHLNLEKFKDFPEKLKQSNIPKDKDILIYCTGGIRCEKACTEMKNQGFTKVKQLQGGILNFLSEFPNTHFNGDCFVFDHRVSVNQKLAPSGNYKLCPHCGQPGKEVMKCAHCQETCTICALCQNKEDYYQTCSKNCAYHYQKGHRHKTKKPSQSKHNSIR